MTDPVRTEPVNQARSTRRRAIAVGAVLPVAIAVVGTALMLSWLPELPDPVVTHWSGTTADGYGPAWMLALTPLGIVALFSAFAVGASWTPTDRGRPTANHKFLLVTAVWLSTLLTIGITMSLAIQRGVEDPIDAGGGDVVGASIGIGALIGLALAAAAWFLLPKADTEFADAEAVEPLPVAQSERVSWSRTIRLSSVAATIVAAALLLAVTTVVVTAVTSSSAVWIAAGTLALLVVLVLATATWRVTADRRGLVVRSGLGWPRVVIPADDIRNASAITVNASADFGGWGWRWDAAGRQGIIMRSGPAIQVTRASGKRFVVTVDDAMIGASVLAAVSAGPAR